MIVTQRVVRGLYRDSVALMQLAADIEKLEGVAKTGAMMATPANLDLAREAGLLDGQPPEAGPNDVLLLVQAEDEETAQRALQEAERKLTEAPKPAAGGEVREAPPSSIRMALEATPDASLALISTPGDYAASEALKALDLGLDVMVFSDNVSVDDEIMLKRLAHERGLLVMGPDCGTAIVAGLPLGFANVVWRGDIGCVGAAGTGLQQVTTLIDRWGAGITHALGTGSHDISAEVGGTSYLDALDALARDEETRVLLLVSKPPAPEVANRILDALGRTGKPAVVCFLGADPADVERPGIRAAVTLEDAAALAVEAAAGSPPSRPDPGPLARAAEDALAALAPGRRFIRGLYSGGTFGYEASLLLSERLGQVWSNTPARPEQRLADPWESCENTIVDLGDDVFTRGRPHPMIDYRLRVERIAKEAADPQVAVVLLDVVLGFGAHPDPAGELVPAIAEARGRAGEGGPVFVASVCGTENDPQVLSRQEAALRDAGVLLAESNAAAVRLAAAVVAGVREEARS
jgi:succinyl-CoA synthetase alpha subunit